MVEQFPCSEAQKRSLSSLAVATFIVALCAFGPTPSAWAEDKRGETEGPTYPIAEPDMLQGIDSKLKSMQQSGELKKKIDEAIDRATNTAQYPKPVKGLGRVRRSKTYYYDPSIVATKAITDASGKVVVSAGTKVNPLEYVAMKEWLIFFDGTDPGQVRIAEELAKKFEWFVKPILTNGGPMDLMRKWKHRVYFDQGGSMVKQLGIQNVPAMVSQEGNVLRIDELSY